MKQIQVTPQPWWYHADRISGIVLVHLWRALVWILEHVMWAGVVYATRGARTTLESMWLSFWKAISRALGRVLGWAIGIALVFALAMAFSANGYSLSATFSADGIKTLWETFK